MKVNEDNTNCKGLYQLTLDSTGKIVEIAK